MVESAPTPRRPRGLERRVLRALLYAVLVGTGALILARFRAFAMPELPRASAGRGGELSDFLTRVTYRLDVTALLVLFVLALGFLAASSRPEPPPEASRMTRGPR